MDLNAIKAKLGELDANSGNREKKRLLKDFLET
jgi:hypothetical protein